MKLDIVAGRSAKEKEWNLGREDHRSDCHQWLPPKAASFWRVPRNSRARASQSVLFQLRDSTPQCKIRSLQFNPDLILLKPPRNAKALPYRHWGGTDHEGLIRVRDGVRVLQFFGNSRSLSLPIRTLAALPSPALLSCPEESPLKMTCHERLCAGRWRWQKPTSFTLGAFYLRM